MNSLRCKFGQSKERIRTRWLCSIVLSLSLTCVSQTAAQESKPSSPPSRVALTLCVGDLAPQLVIDRWLHGPEVASFELGQVYVLAFWASWCGPCIAEMPHLSAIQHQHKHDGVTIIGISSLDPNNPLEAVEKIVASKVGKVIQYPMAWDKGNATKKLYVEASLQHTFPCVYVINKEGKIAHIGESKELGRIIASVLDGSWNMDEERKKFIELRERQVATVEIFEHMIAKRWNRALEAMDAESGGEPLSVEALAKDPYKQLRYVALASLGLDEKAARVGQAWFESHRDSAEGLNSIAWRIVMPESSTKNRDLGLASRAISLAVKLTESKDPGVLDTYARVLFLQGELLKAIEIQKQAIVLAIEAKDEKLTAELQTRLAEYVADSQ